MKRPDWSEVLKLPIGILPTGSGNALAASIMYSAKYVLALSVERGECCVAPSMEPFPNCGSF